MNLSGLGTGANAANMVKQVSQATPNFGASGREKAALRRTIDSPDSTRHAKHLAERMLKLNVMA